MKLLLCCVFFCCSFGSYAQQWDLSLGTELGWWLHDWGSTQSDIRNNRGWAKTHFSAAPFVETGFLFGKKRWKFGPVLNFNIFYEDDMQGPEDSRSNSQRIPIASRFGAVPFFRYGGHLEYQLVSRGGYIFSPAIRYGSFQLWSLHPDQDQFGYRHFTEIVFNQIWHLPKWDLFFRLKYISQKIFLPNSIYYHESHRIYTWGLSLGVRI